MATTPRDRLARELEKSKRLDGFEVVQGFAKAIDTKFPDKAPTKPDGDPYDCQPRTVEAYIRCLRIASDHGLSLLDADTADANDCLKQLFEIRSGTTMLGFQAAFRAFYRFAETDVEPDDLLTFSNDTVPRHDIQDMFTEDEVWQIRDAVSRTNHPVRNRAFLELLIYTAQRVGALATLRTADVDPTDGDTGAIYLNKDVDGLKGALQRGRRRPLFGARKYVRDWLDTRRNNDVWDVENDWLFIGDPNHWKTSPSDYWAKPSIDRMLRQVREFANVDKPLNAHNFRHYCVTVLKRDYDRDWEEINALMGVVEGSTMPQTTYGHIDDNEYMKKVEAGMGFDVEETQNRFAPPVCPICDVVLKPDAKVCPNCKEVFAPGGEQEKNRLVADEALLEDDAFRRGLMELVRSHRDSHTNPS